MNSTEYVTTEEAASRLGYTPQHVRRLVREGRLTGQKVRRDWIVAAESVNHHLLARENLPLALPAASAKAVEDSTVESLHQMSVEEIFAGGEPSLEMKRLAKRLGWSNGAVPGETVHRIFTGDARKMEQIREEEVHLVVTSPPYFNLIQYEGGGGEDVQLGDLQDYQSFLDEMDRVWRRCYEQLAPGGRLCIVVGDVCLSRKVNGRHHVLPLHADIATRCRGIGFDYLTPIFWSKIANMATEVGGSARFLGKPYEPNAIIKNDVEYILLLRKPGSYRKPTPAQRALSLLEPDEHGCWFRSVWTDLPGESRKKGHPAPYPMALAYRLIKMFSFVGDTVLDPFWGTGSTTLAAMEAVRSSVGFEIEPRYVEIGRERLAQVGTCTVPARLEFQ